MIALVVVGVLVVLCVVNPPSTGRRMRAWVDPADASRHYAPEGQQPGHR